MELIFNELQEFKELWFPVGFKVVMAILCGGIIGMERQQKGKAAGFRTNILICLGATLYTLLSVLVSERILETRGGWGADPGRIAAQIVTGIGFLGGGMIIQSRGSVLGLTTAATVWVVAAIGMCIGLGYPIIAFLFTITVFLTLYFLNNVEHLIFSKSYLYAGSILLPAKDSESRSKVLKSFQYIDIDLLDLDVQISDNYCGVFVKYHCSEQRHLRMEANLWSITGVEKVNIERGK